MVTEDKIKNMLAEAYLAYSKKPSTRVRSQIDTLKQCQRLLETGQMTEDKLRETKADLLEKLALFNTNTMNLNLKVRYDKIRHDNWTK